MNNASVIFALKKFRSLLTRREKIKWFWIVGFALLVSTLELLTACVIVTFAHVLNQPEVGHSYLKKIGFDGQYSSGHVVFLFAIAVGVVYVIKNFIAAFEVYFQNFTIQNMSYGFKKKLLLRYANMSYADYTKNNSSYYVNVISEAESVFTSGMISFSTLLSESIIFLSLLIMIVIMNPAVAFAILGLGGVLTFVVTKSMLPQFYRFGKKLQGASLMSRQNLFQFFHGFKEVILLGKKKEFINSYQYYSKKRHVY